MLFILRMEIFISFFISSAVTAFSPLLNRLLMICKTSHDASTFEAKLGSVGILPIKSSEFCRVYESSAPTRHIIHDVCNHNKKKGMIAKEP